MSQSFERRQPHLLSAPAPKYRAAEPDPRKITEWLLNEPDPRLQRIKQQLVNGIERVDFFSFYRSLLEVVEQFNQLSLTNYAVLWDMAPNKSKRWVWSLIENRIKNKPLFTDYSLKVKELAKNYLFAGIKTLVVFDDASYTGTQLLDEIVSRILEAGHDLGLTGELELIFCVPYVGPYVPQIIEKTYQQPTFALTCRMIYTSVMATGPDTLSRSQEDYYRFTCGRQFSDTPKGEMCDHSGSLTIFDHKTADTTSVAWQVFQAIGLDHNEKTRNDKARREPYKDPYSMYLLKENINFTRRYPYHAGLCIESMLGTKRLTARSSV